MFWDKVALFYDLFEDIYNGQVNRNLCKKVISLIGNGDRVLECACGTGMISKHIGLKCRQLIATDYSDGMLKQAKKKCKYLPNVKIRRANIMKLKCRDNSFDKVVAANVVHLLDEPNKAIDELVRACKVGGKVIIPTYVNKHNTGETSVIAKILKALGADFKCQFDYESYKQFIKKTGYENVEFYLINGRMPCAIAVITK